MLHKFSKLQDFLLFLSQSMAKKGFEQVGIKDAEYKAGNVQSMAKAAQDAFASKQKPAYWVIKVR
jgi:hypothetical protein